MEEVDATWITKMALSLPRSRQDYTRTLVKVAAARAFSLVVETAPKI